MLQVLSGALTEIETTMNASLTGPDTPSAPSVSSAPGSHARTQSIEHASHANYAIAALSGAGTGVLTPVDSTYSLGSVRDADTENDPMLMSVAENAGPGLTVCFSLSLNELTVLMSEKKMMMYRLQLRGLEASFEVPFTLTSIYLCCFSPSYL